MAYILNVNRRTYPSQDGNAQTLEAVLVQGEMQDLAVYIGYGRTDWIASHGDKLSYAEACSHFPALCTLEPPFHYRA